MLNLTENVKIKEEKKNETLKRVSYNDKKLTNLPMIKNSNQIEILSINDNEITSLSFCQYFQNLKELYMKNNNINDLKEIDYLSLCKNLHTIYLKGNPIQLNNNLIYIKRIKKVVPSIKIIDGLKIIPNKKLNLYMFLKNSSKNNNIKQFNRELLIKNIKSKNIKINDITLIQNNNEIINKNNLQIHKNYNSVDTKDKKNHFVKLKKYNNGNKICNYANFNFSIYTLNENTKRKRKRDFSFIKRMIDKREENTCINNLNINTGEDNKNEIENANIYNSVLLLLNGLNLLELKQLENYIHKKLSTKINYYE